MKNEKEETINELKKHLRQLNGIKKGFEKDLKKTKELTNEKSNIKIVYNNNLDKIKDLNIKIEGYYSLQKYKRSKKDNVRTKKEFLGNLGSLSYNLKGSF